MNIRLKIFHITSFIDSSQGLKLRYLIVGGWNTLFSFLVGPAIYYGLQGKMHVLLVGAIAYAASITMAFLTHKLFVFRTKGRWLSEYLRSYVVYGGTGAIGIVALWGLVDGMAVPFWLAQVLIVLATVIISYFGHLKFTFYRENKNETRRDEARAMSNLTDNEIKQREYFDGLAQQRRQEANGAVLLKNRYIEEQVYRSIIELPKSQRILEIGCGDGEGGGFTEYFVEMGLDVTFMDISSESVDRLTERLKSLGYKGFTPLSGTFKTVAPRLSGVKFDVVFFGDTLHHLTESETVSLLEDVIPFMHRDSKILAFEPNGYWPFWRIMPSLNKEFIWEVEKNIVHCTRNGFKRKFSAAGMNLEKYTYQRIVPLFLTDRSAVFRAINDILVKIPLLRLLSAYSILIAGHRNDLATKKNQ